MNKQASSFYITTLGCPKNQVDSQTMQRSLLSNGLCLASSPETADFHLINTCTFIQSANEETIETILSSTNSIKKDDQKLIVVGCFAERYSDVIRTDIPEVDLCLGTNQYSKIADVLKENFSLKFKDIHTKHKTTPELLYQNYDKPYFYVKISEGCNRNCNFCIIPKIRGKFTDRTVDEIYEDAIAASQAGIREICLISQDSIHYQNNVDELANLLLKLSDIDALKILRILYLYPDKKTWTLLDHFSKIPKLAPYLESPIQHVSESILKSMGRSGNYEFYKDLFAKARESVPNLEIRTSIILGYPDEKAEDVDLVLKFIQEVKPEKLALFYYSPAEGTKAANLKQTVSQKEAIQRVNMVRDAHIDILKSIHESRLDKIYISIIDEIEGEQAIARRLQDAPEIDEVVFVPAKDRKVGQIGKVRIESFYEYDMEGIWESTIHG